MNDPKNDFIPSAQCMLIEFGKCSYHETGCSDCKIKANIRKALSESSAQTEIYKEKLNEIANALSEKFAYMNTCLNERDTILGYLGLNGLVKFIVILIAQILNVKVILVIPHRQNRMKSDILNALTPR